MSDKILQAAEGGHACHVRKQSVAPGLKFIFNLYSIFLCMHVLNIFTACMHEL